MQYHGLHLKGLKHYVMYTLKVVRVLGPGKPLSDYAMRALHSQVR